MVYNFSSKHAVFQTWSNVAFSDDLFHSGGREAEEDISPATLEDADAAAATADFNQIDGVGHNRHHQVHHGEQKWQKLMQKESVGLLQFILLH